MTLKWTKTVNWRTCFWSVAGPFLLCNVITHTSCCGKFSGIWRTKIKIFKDIPYLLYSQEFYQTGRPTTAANLMGSPRSGRVANILHNMSPAPWRQISAASHSSSSSAIARARYSNS